MPKSIKLVPLYDQPEIFPETHQIKKSFPQKIFNPIINQNPDPKPAKITLFDIFLYIIVGISALISGFNSYLWFISTNYFIIAVALSIMLISCAIIFPRIYKTTHKQMYLFIGYFAIILSIFTTIAGQYNNYTAKQRQQTADKMAAIEAGIDLEQLSTDEIRLNISKVEFMRSKALIEEVIKAYMAKDWYIGNQQKKLESVTANINQIDQQLNEISTQKRLLTAQSQKNTTTRKDFSGFIAGILKINVDTTELIIYCIFAAFIDIICPLVAYNIKYKNKE